MTDQYLITELRNVSVDDDPTNVALLCDKAAQRIQELNEIEEEHRKLNGELRVKLQVFEKACESIMGQGYLQLLDDVDQVFDDSSPHPWLCDICERLWDYRCERGQEHHVLCPVGKAEKALKGIVEEGQ